MRAVAILDPVGDAGIGGYTHELAQALSRAGVDVDVYSTRRAFARQLSRLYSLIGVFGSAALDRGTIGQLYVEARAAREVRPSHGELSVGRPDALDAYFDLLDRRPPRSTRVAPVPADGGTGPARRAADERVRESQSHALADHLRALNYDVVWSQWPELAPYDERLRERCAAGGAMIVHTVHNVLPHERQPGDVERHRAVYRAVDALVTHSAHSTAVLADAFPETASRVVESRHGTYTMYPRIPDARDRVRDRIGASEDAIVALVFGVVRPYKNVDALLRALCDERCVDVRLVVAGWEWGYEDGIAADRLGRTRSIVSQLGLENRVRLLPGPFGVAQTSALFEACDLVPLPYRESFGSGVLCLGMTFARHIVHTRAGGMDEYFDEYDAHTILEDTDDGAIADGMVRAAAAVRGRRHNEPPAAELTWDAIVAALLPRLEAIGSRAAVIR